MGSLVAAPSHYPQSGARRSKLPGLKIQENSISIRPKFLVDTVMGQALFRSYGRLFAEFLDEESLVHLGLLDLSTCVGLRYG
jgi:hypothetical protein